MGEPHSHWKPYSMREHSYIVCELFSYGCRSLCEFVPCVHSIFLCTAGFDYYQKWSFSPRSDACEKGISPSPGTMRSSLSRVLRSLCSTIFLLVTLLFSAGPLFGPLAGLPLRQRWGWLHQCDPYPIELILYGQANSSIPSTISFYMTPSQA